MVWKFCVSHSNGLYCNSHSCQSASPTLPSLKAKNTASTKQAAADVREVKGKDVVGPRSHQVDRDLEVQVEVTATHLSGSLNRIRLVHWSSSYELPASNGAQAALRYQCRCDTGNASTKRCNSVLSCFCFTPKCLRRLSQQRRCSAMANTSPKEICYADNWLKGSLSP